MARATATRAFIYRTRVPGSGGVSKPTSIGLPPSGLAASTMPFDSTPISFAGFRLNTMTTVRRPALPARTLRRCPATSVPLLAADVDLQLHQLVRFRHAFGREHLRDAKLDLHEVVDGNLAARLPAVRPGPPAAARGLFGRAILSQFLYGLFDAREQRRGLAEAGSRRPVDRIVRSATTAQSGVTPSIASARSALAGITGRSKLGDDAQAVGDR